MAFLPRYYHNNVNKNHPFMTCIVKVDTQSQWQRTVTKVLNKCYGVHSFRMDDNGVVEISGTVDPSLLLKMLGKSSGRSTELCWLQFGECSSNLFLQPNHGYYRDGRYLHAPNPCRPKLPNYSQQALNNIQNYGYYDHDSSQYYYSYGHEQDYYPHSYPYQQSYDYQYGNSSHARLDHLPRHPAVVKTSAHVD